MRKLNVHSAWVLLLSLALISGCASINPLKAAETNEQRAYAAYGTFVIFQEKAVDLAQNTSLSRSTRLGIIRAEERAKPVADSLNGAITEFLVIKAEFDAGNTTEQRVIIASNNLNNWITRLVPLTNQLISTVKGAD